MNDFTDFINEHNDYCVIVMESEAKNNESFFVLGVVAFVTVDYQALVIAGDNMESARNFIEYLKSDEAKDILLKNGYFPER